MHGSLKLPCFFCLALACYSEHVEPIVIVGYIAGAICTGSFLPQVFHTFRTRSCRDITYAMLLAMTTGTGLWTAYGVVLHQWPIIVANGTSMCLLLSLLAMKFLFSRPPAAAASVEES